MPGPSPTEATAGPSVGRTAYPSTQVVHIHSLTANGALINELNNAVSFHGTLAQVQDNQPEHRPQLCSSTCLGQECPLCHGNGKAQYTVQCPGTLGALRTGACAHLVSVRLWSSVQGRDVRLITYLASVGLTPPIWILSQCPWAFLSLVNVAQREEAAAPRA